MADPDATTDPVDKAYAEAEMLLGDDAARAARRARVLDAVAREPVSPFPEAEPARARSAWRRGGWLAAASVALFCAFLAGRIYQPVRDQAPAALTLPASGAGPAAVSARAFAPSSPPVLRKTPALASRSRVAPEAPAPRQAPAEPAPDAFAPSPPPPALAAPAPPPPAQTATGSLAGEVTVTGSRIARNDFAKATPARVGAAVADGAARLRAAAAEGRTEDIETLLAQGVPVDSADPEGATALMRSVQADQPAAAEVLRRHGASLDRKDRRGASAREMARAKGDPDLDRALGLTDGQLGSK